MAPSEPPDLAEFVARHARPYDPETDTCRRPPFAQPVKAGKNGPICYTREFYAEGAALFAHVDGARVSAEEFRAVKRMAAVCQMRAGQIAP